MIFNTLSNLNFVYQTNFNTLFPAFLLQILQTSNNITAFYRVKKINILTYIKFLLDESGVKETPEWLSSDIFGKVVQIKKSVTIDRYRTSINLNDNIDSLAPASKISDLPTGWICGKVARDFVATKTGRRDSIDIQEAEEFKTSKFYCKTDFDMTEITKEEEGYVPLPKFYTFPSKEARERVLYANFLRVNQDVKDMVKDVLKYRVKK